MHRHERHVACRVPLLDCPGSSPPACLGSRAVTLSSRHVAPAEAAERRFRAVYRPRTHCVEGLAPESEWHGAASRDAGCSRWRLCDTARRGVPRLSVCLWMQAPPRLIVIVAHGTTIQTSSECATSVVLYTDILCRPHDNYVIVKWIDDDTESGLIPASMVSTLKVRSYPGSARVGFANLSCRGMHCVHCERVCCGIRHANITRGLLTQAVGEGFSTAMPCPTCTNVPVGTVIPSSACMEKVVFKPQKHPLRHDPVVVSNWKIPITTTHLTLWTNAASVCCVGLFLFASFISCLLFACS